MQSQTESAIEVGVQGICSLGLVGLYMYIMLPSNQITSYEAIDPTTVILFLNLGFLKNYIIRRLFNYGTALTTYDDPVDQLKPYLPDNPRALPTGSKYDEGKTRWDLLPIVALEQIARVLTFGSNKYNDWNWINGIAYSRLYRASIGHLNSWWSPLESNDDKETGISHLAHAGCCILFLITYEVLGWDHLDNKPDIPSIPDTAIDSD